MNPDEMAAHIMRFYDQNTEAEAMTEAIAHTIRKHSQSLEKRLAELNRIMSDIQYQIEVTKGGYYIYRFDVETMHRIADALGIERGAAQLFMATYTLEELTKLIR